MFAALALRTQAVGFGSAGVFNQLETIAASIA
jgi:hypothetical protein